MQINITYRISVVDRLDEDEEFGYMAYEDNYFVVTGLPDKHLSAFWKEMKKIRGCSRRSSENSGKDRRLRVDWNNFYDYDNFLKAKEKILKTIRKLVPDAQVRYRQLGSGLSEIGDYAEDNMIMLELKGGLTDKERQ